MSIPGDELRVMKPEQTWRLARVIIQSWMRPLTRLRVYGAGRIPLSGGCVIAANHVDAIDPFILGTSCPRSIRYMAKVELWHVPVVRHLVAHTGAFPVRRGEPDRSALAAARDVLRAGHLLGMFVEGTRQATDEVGAARAGAAMLALFEQVPILPVYLHGTDRHQALRPAVTIVYGTPIRVAGARPSRTNRVLLADAIEDELRRLRDFTLAAVAAGRPRQAVPPVSRQPVERDSEAA